MMSPQGASSTKLRELRGALPRAPIMSGRSLRKRARCITADRHRSIYEPRPTEGAAREASSFTAARAARQRNDQTCCSRACPARPRAPAPHNRALVGTGNRVRSRTCGHLAELAHRPAPAAEVGLDHAADADEQRFGPGVMRSDQGLPPMRHSCLICRRCRTPGRARSGGRRRRVAVGSIMEYGVLNSRRGAARAQCFLVAVLVEFHGELPWPSACAGVLPSGPQVVGRLEERGPGSPSRSVRPGRAPAAIGTICMRFWASNFMTRLVPASCTKIICASSARRAGPSNGSLADQRTKLPSG